MNEIVDSDISLIFGPVPKKSFNRSLATLSLRTNANTPDNGYHIYASATFGSQIVRLQARNTEFDVIFDIHEAEIVFSTIRTELTFGHDYEKHVSIRNEPIKTENSIAEKRNVGISVAPRDIKASSSNPTEFISKNTMDKLPTSFDHERLEFVKIGKRTNDHPLEGMVVVDYNGWIANPLSSSETSGVRAELNVQESWVRFHDPSTESQSVVGRIWNKVSNSGRKEHQRKKELFADLLKILSMRGLQASHQGNSATLDISGILCIPNDPSPRVEGSNLLSSSNIDVDEMLLLEFLQCPLGSEQSTFDSIIRRTKNEEKPSIFLPESSVASAYEAYKKIYPLRLDNRLRTRAIAEKKFGRNEIKDLLHIGLLSLDDKTLHSMNPYPDQALDSSFRIQVSKFNTIQFVRDLLQDHPNLKATAIGERVAVYLGRSWKTSSCQSRGQRLRYWTAFVYGSLLVTQKGQPIDRLLNSGAEYKKSKGPKPFLSGDNLIQLSKLKSQGLTIKKMAEVLGTTPQVISNWKRNYPDQWENL